MRNAGARRGDANDPRAKAGGDSNDFMPPLGGRIERCKPKTRNQPPTLRAESFKKTITSVIGPSQEPVYWENFGKGIGQYVV
jgi:hypothetical protein